MKVSIDNQIIIVLRVSIVDMIKYIHKLKIKNLHTQNANNVFGVPLRACMNKKESLKNIETEIHA